MGGTLPAAASKLKVVGEPFFDDRESYSHACLKQCPQCGAYYNWEFTYEFLVNGTEDDIVLARLSDEEGERRAKKIFDAIKADAEKFRSEAESRLKTLHHAPKKGIYGAAHFLRQGQMRGHDMAFAVHALVSAFIRVSNIDGEDSYLDSCASLIYFVLSDAVKGSQDAAAAREVINMLRDHSMTTKDIERFNWLIADCKKVMQSRE